MPEWGYIALTLPVILLVMGLYAMLIAPFRFKVRRYEVALPGLPDAFEGLKIVFLTDLHMGRAYPRSAIMRVFTSAMRHNPDLILLGGDYTWGFRGKPEKFFALTPVLKAPLGVYGVVGNHDLTRLNRILRILPGSGVTLLRNQGVRLEHDGQALGLYGLDDLIWDHPGVEDIAAFRTQCGAPLLMLAHHPDTMENLLEGPHTPWDLAFCGHTHDGQLVLPGNRKPFAPYRNRDAGLLSVGGKPLVLSAGIGTSGLPARFRSPPDYCLVTLRRENIHP